MSVAEVKVSMLVEHRVDLVPRTRNKVILVRIFNYIIEELVFHQLNTYTVIWEEPQFLSLSHYL